MGDYRGQVVRALRRAADMLESGTDADEVVSCFAAPTDGDDAFIGGAGDFDFEGAANCARELLGEEADSARSAGEWHPDMHYLCWGVRCVVQRAEVTEQWPGPDGAYDVVDYGLMEPTAARGPSEDRSDGHD